MITQFKIFEESIFYEEGDLIYYKNDKGEEIPGEISDIRTAFKAYDDIETDYIIKDEKTELKIIVPYEKIRHMTELEKNTKKYNI